MGCNSLSDVRGEEDGVLWGSWTRWEGEWKYISWRLEEKRRNRLVESLRGKLEETYLPTRRLLLKTATVLKFSLKKKITHSKPSVIPVRDRACGPLVTRIVSVIETLTSVHKPEHPGDVGSLNSHVTHPPALLSLFHSWWPPTLCLFLALADTKQAQSTPSNWQVMSD